jgi:hypothetical protein
MKNKNSLSAAALKTGSHAWMITGTLAAALGISGVNALAHGYAGARFFPPTIQTDDPFAADELAFPTASTIKNTDGRETDVGLDFSKEIFPHFSLGFSETWIHLNPNDQPAVSGFDNLTLSTKYELWINEPHETIVSVGGEWDVGGTGTKRIGADSTHTFTPQIYFGKGLGDLPDSLKYAKPVALTGVIGQSFSTRAEPNNLEWGFALEYSLPYLQSTVKDIGLSEPFKSMIPLVEFSMESPENRDGGQTTGTVNPGILWETQHFQIGAEAIIPVNRASGNSVGAVVQIQFYLDDLLPKWFGHPVFGEQ